MYVHGWLAPYSINLLFLHCLHCYDFCGRFLRKRFSTTRFAIWSYSRKIFYTYIYIYIYVFLYAFDACFRFCHTDKLYESSRRKPGWRFTAGCELVGMSKIKWRIYKKWRENWNLIVIWTFVLPLRIFLLYIRYRSSVLSWFRVHSIVFWGSWVRE